jgi:hypothetical protein
LPTVTPYGVDESRQAGEQRVAFGGSHRRDPPLVLRVERGAKPGVERTALFGEPEPIQPPIRGITLSHQQSPAFHLCRHAADRALLQPESVGQVALREWGTHIELVQCERQGERYLRPGPSLVGLQHTCGPRQLHQ